MPLSRFLITKLLGIFLIIPLNLSDSSWHIGWNSVTISCFILNNIVTNFIHSATNCAPRWLCTSCILTQINMRTKILTMVLLVFFNGYCFRILTSIIYQSWKVAMLIKTFGVEYKLIIIFSNDDFGAFFSGSVLWHISYDLRNFVMSSSIPDH